MPSTGVIFTATPGTRGGWANTSHLSFDDAVAHINDLVFQQRPAYFAVATYEHRRVFDSTWQNPATGKVEGKWRYRTQENAQYIKSFFLDLDVDPSDANKFPSKAQAVADLKALALRIGLPRPMVVDSGGGIHAYWPLAMAVLTSDWRPVADQFKAICLHEGFRADRSLTSDQARVLRVPGSYNTRRGAAVKVMCQHGAALSFADFAQRIADYAGQLGQLSTPTRHASALTAPPADPFGAGNLGATNDPLNLDLVAFGCAQIALQVAARGKGIGEQLWRAGLGIAKFCEPQEAAWRVISDGHPEFDPAATQQKIINWHTGPTKCDHFHQLNPKVCEGCPHWGKMTSPAQLGRVVVEAAPPAPVQVAVAADGAAVAVELPTLPDPYKRRAHDNAICMYSEADEGVPVVQVVSPYDLYPLALRAQSGADNAIDERSMWRVHLPMERGAGTTPRDIDVPLSMMADQKSLAKYLMSKGVILTGDQAKMTQQYMTAYLQKLAREAGREKLYERLGWHDDHHTFVLGDRVLHRDGSSTLHQAGAAIRNTTRGGLKTAGTLDGWKKAIAFYNQAGYEGHRFFLYAALGAPIFHMNDTGNKGVLMTASGQSGRGKTTCLKACGSLWGHPDALMMNGNKDGSTVNALYSAIGTTHSLPFLWDDITERDPDELRRFLLNISQGQGKRRMTADAAQSDRMDTWETIVLATANTDDISRIMSTGRNVDPHLMRMVGVEFNNIDTSAEAKIRADEFLRALNENYGHVGPVLAGVMVKHYDTIRKGYIKNVAMVDRLLASGNASAERYWSAAVAAAYTGAQLASKLGLIDFPYEQDLQWMVAHLGRQRAVIRESTPTPLENLTLFLDSHIRNTLVIASKVSSNLDNIAVRPLDELQVRHEVDAKTIYISRAAIMHYCGEEGISFKQMEYNLEHDHVITKRHAQKVLGADTVYASGQTRCWQIDATRVNVGATGTPPMPSATNVVPMRKTP